MSHRYDELPSGYALPLLINVNERELHVLLIGLFKEAICLAVPVHLEIFHLCFSFCNLIIENVV
jgi:hypothetical protein